MIATKVILLTLAAYAIATPVASAPEPATTAWVALKVPHDAIDWTGIDMADFNNPANWESPSAMEIDNKTSSNIDTSGLQTRSGPCSQGTCPDNADPFDLVYTFTAIPDVSCPECPPITYFSSSSSARVNDCNQCQIHVLGTSLGESIPGGCYDFNSCGRDQTICLDPGNSRAHRIWKDNGVRNCYNLNYNNLGSCGFIKSRILLQPTSQVACTW